MPGADHIGKVCVEDLPREALVELLVRAAVDILALESRVYVLEQAERQLTLEGRRELIRADAELAAMLNKLDPRPRRLQFFRTAVGRV